MAWEWELRHIHYRPLGWNERQDGAGDIMRDKVRLETEPPSGKLQQIYKTDLKTAAEEDAIDAVFMHSRR